ncbi:alpha/beta hydrolase [Pusillimonas sp. (ex Stolz et al. 2005)]|uniref:alpha/beta hydrolase n=1 Tax=Pusillimonas sp. (ex Stolz et al. 2005) TaxID=1979962 RepID=UPI00260D78C2|nr:alpha/beta hydrolase [Pusillimonas sp. (ex Stolz et al. 2005)]
MTEKQKGKRPSLGIDWFPQALPNDTRTEVFTLRTPDGASVLGTLYTRGQPRNVACLMHPREYFGAHYLVPALLERGMAVWTQGARSIGNDLRLEHEQAVIDAATGIQFLRQRDFEKIVLIGNSGGSGVYSYYIQQSTLAPEQRLAKSPVGKPTRFDTLDMPAVDAMVYLAPHPGQGRLLMGCIDPSVVDENDALSVDPGLDPFNPENGYVPEPGQSRYTPDFVERYRAAQRSRVERIDAIARQLIERRQNARRQVKEGSSERAIRLQAAHTPIITVWRTDADLRNIDLTLDPSDRAPGSIWGNDPLVSNYGAVGFGRLCSPESWLSTWSGVSSQAALEKTAPYVRVPTLLVEYTGDQTTFPLQIKEIFSWIGASDKQHVRVHGDHHGRPIEGDPQSGRSAAATHITNWLAAHGFV